jgi:hypothetical protein
MTLGSGFDASILIGGSRRSISLQPLSFSSQTGLNLAAGVGALNLQPTGLHP